MPEVPPHANDLQLARLVSQGDEPAWHRFVENYGALLLSVLRKRLSRDEDEVRDVFVNVLAELKEKALLGYEGRASLATWLVVVAERRALDQIRRRTGRRFPDTEALGLDEPERIAFRAFFWEGRSFEMVRHELAERGLEISTENLSDLLEDLRSRLDPRVVRRMAESLVGRTFVPLDGLDGLPELAVPPDAPDLLEQRDAQQRAVALRRALADLTEEERGVLLRRYRDNRTAAEVAEELGLSGTRKVYTIVERAIRRLRSSLEGETRL